VGKQGSARRSDDRAATAGAGQAHGDRTLLVLLGLRLRSFASNEAVAESSGLDEALVRVELERSHQRGWTIWREGRLRGWSLTPAGRAEGQRRLADELDRRGARPTVEAVNTRFASLNQTLLDVCTAWQLRDDSTPNDHRDAAYDAGVIERLVGIHADAEPLCGELAGALRRFAGYGERLGAAIERVRRGEQEWFTSVRVASYHSVWFELHENLLATLGIERGSEPA
jgi:hypothetical protein